MPEQMLEEMPEQDLTLCCNCKWIDSDGEGFLYCGKYPNPEIQCSLSIVEKVVFDSETLFTILPYASSFETLKAARIANCE